MRQMSFMLTTDQLRQQTKTVTRRLGWRDLQPGDLIQPVVKCQGLKKGQRVEKIGGPIRIVSVQSDRLRWLCDPPETWAQQEMAAEGFPGMSGQDFAAMFIRSHKGATLDSNITRIEFEYTEAAH